MRSLFFFSVTLLFLSFSTSFAQEAKSFREDIKAFQEELNVHYKDTADSPLLEEDRKKFKHLPFYPINEDYRIIAKFEETPDTDTFEMETTTDRRPIYRKYGVATFELEGDQQQLSIYQNQKLIKKEGYEKHLFLPFADLTNGDGSYGGGRFLDLEIPEADTIVIDFNKAYNPYCAYNHKYSCPIPPKENRMEVTIKAGVKAPKAH